MMDFPTGSERETIYLVSADGGAKWTFAKQHLCLTSSKKKTKKNKRVEDEHEKSF